MVEWTTGMDYWNGILEWTRTKSFHLHIICDRACENRAYLHNIENWFFKLNTIYI